MSYAVIDVDGTLHVRDATPSADIIRGEVGGWERGYWEQVRLPVFDNVLRGFVSETGFPDGLARNVVGSLLLMALGAPAQPYAGPVVITGWDPRGEDGKPKIGDVPVMPYLSRLHQCVTHTLAGDDTCPNCTDGWRAGVLDTANMVRTAPTPQIQVFYPGDLGRP